MKTYSKSVFDIQDIKQKFKESLTLFINLNKSWEVEPILITQANRLITNPDTSLMIYKRLYDALYDFGINYIECKEMYDSLNEIIREVAFEYDILCLDLDKIVPPESDYFYDLVHYKDNGSSLVAKIISEQLTNKINRQY